MALFDSGNGSYLKSAQKFEITEGLVDEIFIKVFEELKKTRMKSSLFIRSFIRKNYSKNQPQASSDS
ncbi:hypothetical protein DFR54_10140 [Vagococcus fluvialis]|uniref:hypothetical protein n=1 Tax=Vagococcus fluvialis TaxID=2738 RepID=UPI000DF96E04|nr:hypothetical protein [Vagococcus fluvialis]RCX15705.1 hypothetical protein DFR54_10140 [Vagococcus fluvialis]WNF89086.1 hypothetical protein QDW48_07865 [Vagococcus fluvialis]